MCKCLELKVKGQMCFLFWPYAVHHMGMSIFHLGLSILYDMLMPYCNLGSLPALLFSVSQHKISAVWLIMSQMYSFGLFPSGSLGSQGGRIWDKCSQFPVMSPDSSFTGLSLTPHGELCLPDHYFPAEAIPCNCIYEASCSSFLWSIQMNVFEFHGWGNVFMKPGLMPWCCPLIFTDILDRHSSPEANA